MTEKPFLAGQLEDGPRMSAELMVLRIAVAALIRHAPQEQREQVMKVLGWARRAADELNGEEAGPGFTEEYTHQIELAARRLVADVKMQAIKPPEK